MHPVTKTTALTSTIPARTISGAMASATKRTMASITCYNYKLYRWRCRSDLGD